MKRWETTKESEGCQESSSWMERGYNTKYEPLTGSCTSVLSAVREHPADPESDLPSLAGYMLSPPFLFLLS